MPRLHRLQAIAEYLGYSEKVCLTLIRHRGFPATKFGQDWVTHTELIDDWEKQEIVKDVQQGLWDDKKKPKKVNNTAKKW